MDDFDIDLNSDIGTSVVKLKTNTNQQTENKHSDTEIDYDKIIENINNSETIKQVNTPQQQENLNTNNIKINKQEINKPETNKQEIYKRNIERDINMSELVKNIESDLDNINMPKTIMSTINKKINNDSNNDSNNNINNHSNNYFKNIMNVKDFKNRDILLYILLFMLLNNKFIIELIYEKVPFIRALNNPYPNLIIRSIIFGLLIYFIKKFNL
jgi:hypothetical protein